jgi:RNA polymerase sigma factor (sigma-70 family)
MSHAQSPIQGTSGRPASLDACWNKGIRFKNSGISIEKMAEQAVLGSGLDFEAEALREIECSLHGKLRAHQVSEEFIERYGEDALQQGVAEYARALRRGDKIENPDAWIVHTSFWRAVDELRREARRADGSVAEALIEMGSRATPAAEEMAVERLAVEELREAMERLSPEEQRVLSLRYFEELDNEAGARVLLCSERTYRRRLSKTQKKLARLLGAPLPEPGSMPAIEIGLLAWASLRGAEVVPSAHPLDRLPAAADGVREGVAWMSRNLKELAGRIFAGDTAEKVGAIAGGPAGKVVGSCAGALTLCTLTGVVGPGVGGFDVLEGTRDQTTARHTRPHKADEGTGAGAEEAAITSAPPVPHPGSVEVGQGSDRQSAEQTKKTRQSAERRQVERQTSGFARAASEATPAPSVGASSSTTGGEPDAAGTPSIPDSSTPATEAAQAKQQFGAFK